MISLLYVALGGATGAVLRYLVGQLPLGVSNGFPITTLLINAVGSFLIGVIAFKTGKSDLLSPQAVLFLKVGFCGGFTTFSTFSLELFQLIESGKCFTGILYGICSIVICLFGILIAHMVCS